MTRPADRRPRGRWVFVAGVGSFVLLEATLIALAGMAVLDALYLGTLLTLLPALAVAQLDLVGDVSLERLPAYGGSIVALIVLTGASLAVGTRGAGLASVGLVPLSSWALVGWTAALLAMGLVTILVFRHVASRLGISESPLLRELIPRTRDERVAFAVLSLWAGVGEELTYRGYAILVLAPLVGPAGGVAVTAVVFGVLHAYQGAFGMVRTATLGAILGWGFLAAGSLWPAIVAHVLIDVVGGLVLADRLMVPEPAARVEEPNDLTHSSATGH